MDIQLQNSTAAEHGMLGQNEHSFGFSWSQIPIFTLLNLPGAEAANFGLGAGRGGRIEAGGSHDFGNGVTIGGGASYNPRTGKVDEGRLEVEVRF